LEIQVKLLTSEIPIPRSGSRNPIATMILRRELLLSYQPELSIAIQPIGTAFFAGVTEAPRCHAAVVTPGEELNEHSNVFGSFLLCRPKCSTKVCHFK
jgi:hypothetical protein